MTTEDPDLTFYTTAEVATKFKVSQQTVRNWIAEGQLKARQINNFYRISHADLVEFAQRRYPV